MEKNIKTVKVVRTNKITSEMSAKELLNKVHEDRIKNKEKMAADKIIRDKLISAINIFNTQGAIFPGEIDDLEVSTYIDQDRHENYILINRHLVNTKEKEQDIRQRLHLFYNNTYNCGTECLDKSRLLRKVMKGISPDLEISSTTLFSFMLIFNPWCNDVMLMSQFWYDVVKLSNPEIFNN